MLPYLLLCHQHRAISNIGCVNNRRWNVDEDLTHVGGAMSIAKQVLMGCTVTYILTKVMVRMAHPTRLIAYYLLTVSHLLINQQGLDKGRFLPENHHGAYIGLSLY